MVNEYSKRAKIIIYILGVLVVCLIAIGNYYHNKTDDETIVSGKKLRVVIFNISCSNSTRSKSSLWFRNDKNEVKHVNVTSGQCENYKIGDSINVLFNQKFNWYLINTH